MQVLAIKLGWVCCHIVMAVFFVKVGFVLLGLANWCLRFAQALLVYDIGFR
jgi:hypothetical protein